MDFSTVGAAAAEALTLASFIGIGGGVLLGYIVGVIPGLSRSVAISIAIPMTFYMSPYIAISFLIGLSKGTAAGSAVSAILLNAPGEASSAATALDGYPLAKSGRPKTALQIGLIASVAGDIMATIILIFVAIPFARVALLFGPYEMAAILAFAMVFIAGLSGGNLFKGLAAGGAGHLPGHHRAGQPDRASADDLRLHRTDGRDAADCGRHWHAGAVGDVRAVRKAAI